jgi:acid phosphatase
MWFGTGLAVAQSAAGCPFSAGTQIFDPGSPNLGLLKLWLREYRCTKYDVELVQKLTGARVWIERRAREVARPAIVLDIDETSLSNWEQIYRNDFAFIPGGSCDKDAESACGQRAWELSASAVAIEPTLQLFNAAKARSIAVFFVTGRYDDPAERAATEENLRRVGYHDWDGLFLRPVSTRGRPVAEYKTATRAGIEAQFTIIANIGDQESDLVNGHAEQRFSPASPTAVASFEGTDPKTRSPFAIRQGRREAAKGLCHLGDRNRAARLGHGPARIHNFNGELSQQAAPSAAVLGVPAAAILSRSVWLRANRLMTGLPSGRGSRQSLWRRMAWVAVAADIRVISDRRNPNATVFTLKRFIVESGRPGAISD